MACGIRVCPGGDVLFCTLTDWGVCIDCMMMGVAGLALSLSHGTHMINF